MFKNSLGLLTVLIALLVMFRCMGEDGVDGLNGLDGEDGENGKAALAYSWSGEIWDIYSSDNTIPPVFVNGTYYYPASLGTYTYSYKSSVGTWTGYYTIWIDEGETGTNGQPGVPGEPGDLFWQDGADGVDGVDGVDGEDGEDMCFELYMFSFAGPGFFPWTCSYEGITLPKGAFHPNSKIREKFIAAQIRDEQAILAHYGSKMVINPSKNGVVEILTDDESIITHLDSLPSAFVEQGQAGKYYFIHKYMLDGSYSSEVR